MKKSMITLFLPTLFLCASAAAIAADSDSSRSNDYIAVTVDDPDIPPDELSLLVKPLTAAELEVEADAWLLLLRDKTTETSQAELAIRQKNKTIEKAEEVQESLEDTKDILEEVQDASKQARDDGTAEAAEEARNLADEAKQSAAETADTIDQALTTTQEVAGNDSVQQALKNSETVTDKDLSAKAAKTREATEQVSLAAGKTAAAAGSGKTEDAARLAAATVDAVDDAKTALVETSEAVSTSVAEQDQVVAASGDANLSQTAAIVGELAESEMEDKKDILLSVNELKAQRTGLVDRLNVVVDELSSKLGESAEGVENERVISYRLYAEAVSDVEVDVSDTQALWSNLLGWLRSDVGGLRLARNLGKFLATVFGFWVIGLILGKLVDKALAMTRITVELMRSVMVRTVRRATYIVGIIAGLSAMDINVGPILAVVGAAGFVVAFALQNTLSNFASGIMIMIYRPYDVGDVINVSGITGVARSMNLVNTTVATLDNQLLIVPNNSIWGNVITNITGSETRRVDLLFGISYQDDVDVALQVLQRIVDEHPLVLDEPEPKIALNALSEYKVEIICWPWAKTSDYWQVYRDITRSAKEQFAQAGLVTPYPHQNIQIAQAPGANSG